MVRVKINAYEDKISIDANELRPGEVKDVYDYILSDIENYEPYARVNFIKGDTSIECPDDEYIYDFIYESVDDICIHFGNAFAALEFLQYFGERYAAAIF